MKIFLSTAIVLFCFCNVFGCSYIGYPEPPLSYLISKIMTIYYGKVISIKTRYQKDEDGDLYRIRRMKVKVERTLKGEHKEYQEFALYNQVNAIKDSCYVKPTKVNVGETWLIRTDLDPEIESRSYRWNSSFVSYFKFDPKEETENVKDLEKIIQNPVTAVYGQVDNSSPFPAIRATEVFLEGNGLQLSTKPDGFGLYAFENIPAGNYKIQIRFPTKAKDFFTKRETVYNEQTKTDNFEYEVSLKTGDSDFYYVLSNRPF